MTRIHSFAPIIDQQAQVLILGSIPGVESLAKQQYYANKRNHFWQLLCILFDQPLASSYVEKISFLKEQRLALWDVIGACYREGSLDTAIKQEEVNDFSWLFMTYPGIRYVFFNGGKAYETFRKKVGFAQYASITFTKLPSTSPAHTISFEHKLQQWQSIIACMSS